MSVCVNSERTLLSRVAVAPERDISSPSYGDERRPASTLGLEVPDSESWTWAGPIYQERVVWVLENLMSEVADWKHVEQHIFARHVYKQELQYTSW